MEKKTFRQLVAELMMDAEKYGDLIVTDCKIIADYDEEYGDLIVTDYKIIADYDEDNEIEWSYEADADDVEEYYNEDMGFDPYLGCYTDDC